MNFLVSVIVPCYNQAQYLPETLESVLLQTYQNWECIIVNDGSPDNTEEIAKLYCNKDNRFKYIHKENGGLSSARNSGIKSSIGEYILPLDSDDLIGEEYIEKAIQHFKVYPETKLVYCKASFFGNKVGEWKLADYNYSELLFGNMIFCSALYKRVDYDKTSYYNENLILGFEDWDFWLTLLNEEDQVYRIPEICFFYRTKDHSMLSSLSEQSAMQLRIKIYDDHREKFEKYIPNLIWLNPELTRQHDYILSLEKEIKRIQLSKAYRLGKYILKPFSILSDVCRAKGN